MAKSKKAQRLAVKDKQAEKKIFTIVAIATLVFLVLLFMMFMNT